MQYTVVNSDSLERFLEIVNKNIEEGWTPQGGVSTRNYVAHRNHHGDASEVTVHYSQAMVKSHSHQ